MSQEKFEAFRESMIAFVERDDIRRNAMNHIFL